MFSIQRIECLLYTEERVSLLFLYTKERVSSLHGEESVLLLFVEVLAVEAFRSGELASERIRPIDAPPGYTFKTSGSSGLRNVLHSRSNTTRFAWPEPSDVPVSKELMEPPDMYSSGEFNDNEALYMSRERPCLGYVILIQGMIY